MLEIWIERVNFYSKRYDNVAEYKVAMKNIKKKSQGTKGTIYHIGTIVISLDEYIMEYSK